MWQEHTNKITLLCVKGNKVCVCTVRSGSPQKQRMVTSVRSTWDGRMLEVIHRAASSQSTSCSDVSNVPKTYKNNFSKLSQTVYIPISTKHHSIYRFSYLISVFVKYKAKQKVQMMRQLLCRPSSHLLSNCYSDKCFLAPNHNINTWLSNPELINESFCIWSSIYLLSLSLNLSGNICNTRTDELAVSCPLCQTSSWENNNSVMKLLSLKPIQTRTR